jgi:hypothetical protein
MFQPLNLKSISSKMPLMGADVVVTTEWFSVELLPRFSGPKSRAQIIAAFRIASFVASQLIA